MSFKVEKLSVETSTLGEGPHWDAETQTLYYVDIRGQTINKYVPSTNKHTKAHIGKPVTVIIPVKGKQDEFVITSEREIVLIQWDGENDSVTIIKKLYEVDENTNNRFNDGKCDPTGRLWAGTLSVEQNYEKLSKRGSLYSFKDGKVTKHLSQIGISNGIAFDTTLNKLYYVDSSKGTLDQYDFDVTKGTISNGIPIFTLFKELKGLNVLDGMAIDTDGNLWVAAFNLGRIIKVDPRKPGVEADSIPFPVKQVTSVAFGGPNLDELYVTTGKLTVKNVAPSSPDDGSLYRVTGLNAKGFPGERVAL